MTHVDNPFKSPVVLSFCPGILGIERGLARAGVDCRVAAYVEIEAYIIANLVAGMEAGLVDPAPIWTDAKTFDARPFRGKVHGIIGGYPCPGESLAGLREGHLYKGFLWPALRKAIPAARPLWCFFENVDDHLTGTYPIVQRSLRNMGYRVEEGIYTAGEVGAPHERKRLFILAVANANCSSTIRGFGNLLGKGRQNEEEAWQRERSGNEPGNIGKELAYAIGPRLSKQWHYGQQEEEINNRIGCSGSTLWPAGQGYYQHSWEEPRIIESGVGCTINGYNFREDILRAIGNSVVEQTAELAFIDLIHKHLKYLA